MNESQGLLSFHSLNPWLFPFHAFGVNLAPNYAEARGHFNTEECAAQILWKTEVLSSRREPFEGYAQRVSTP